MKFVYIPTRKDVIFYILLWIAAIAICVIVAKCNRADGNGGGNGPEKSVPADDGNSM